MTDSLPMGNLDACRDWGFAGDYVRAMWSMLQQDCASDYVVSTGISHSVKQLVEMAFSHVGLDWSQFVITDDKLFRPAEVEHLVGDNSKAMKELDWSPSVAFSDLVKMMVDADLKGCPAMLVRIIPRSVHN